MSDSALLRQFVFRNDQAAFAALTRRHINFVYAAARRQVQGDAHAAADITQQVFVDLAHKARQLSDHPCLAGWLYACTRFTAINTLRSNQRRASREKEAQAMQLTATPAADWEMLRPLIDDALQELSERDREFVLLRFFDQRSFAAIGEPYGVSENAAQKAVARALDLLNAALAKRGVTSTSAALAIALGQAVEAAPDTVLSAVVAAIASPVAVGVGGMTTVIATAKLAAVLAVVAGMALSGGYWIGAQRQIAADQLQAAALDQRHAAEIRQAVERVRAESRRATLAEADTAALLRAIEQTKAERQQRQLAETANLPRTTQLTTYVLRPGDTAAKIAHAYGLPLSTLRTANTEVNWARLRVGQVITMPAGALLEPLQPAPNIPATVAEVTRDGGYTIRPGDSLTTVMTTAGISQEDLQRLNPGVDLTHLTVGQTIRTR